MTDKRLIFTANISVVHCVLGGKSCLIKFMASVFFYKEIINLNRIYLHRQFGNLLPDILHIRYDAEILVINIFYEILESPQISYI